MKNKMFFSFVIAILFIMSLGSTQIFADTTTEDYKNYVYPMSTYKQLEVQPFSVPTSGQAENISPASGDLEITQTDLYLKGKNGLDFTLTRSYNTSDAKLYEPYSIGQIVLAYLVQGYYIQGTETKETYVNGILSERTTRSVPFCVSASGNTTSNPYEEMPSTYFSSPEGVSIPYYVNSTYWSTSQQAQKMADDFNRGVYDKAITTPSGNNTILTVTKYSDSKDFSVDIRYRMATQGQYYIFNNQIIYLNPGSPFPATQQYYDSTSRLTTTDKYSNLGTGWSFDFQYIEKRGDTDHYLHLGKQGAIHFTCDTYYYDVLVASTLPNNIGPQFYPITLDKDGAGDLSLYYILNRGTSAYSNSEMSAKYKLVDKRGKVMYFGSDGRLMSIQDQFGNEIQFFHTTSINAYPLVTQIVDSVKRNINIKYETTKVTVELDDPTNPANNRRIYYNKTPCSSDTSEYLLTSVQDAENRITTYEYEEKSGSFCYRKKDPYPDRNFPVGSNRYELLKRIIYPTGGKTEYNYNDGKYSYKNIGLLGFEQLYKIENRADYTKDGKKYNYKSYKYYNYFNGDGTLEFDGYPAYFRNSIPTGFQVKSDVRDTAANTETYTYNYIKNPSSNRNDLLCVNVLSQGADYKKETINGYDIYSKLLTQYTTRTYNQNAGNYVEKIEKYQYDNVKNLTGYWNSQANGDISNTEHKTSYTYNKQYNYITSKTYKKDAGTTILEEYTPYADDARKIEWAKVKENGVLKKQTRYLYDSTGNVTEEWQYKDGWSNYVPIKYSYTDNVSARNGKFNGAYVTRKWVDGVKDADGNNAVTIDENYIYDWFGNAVEKKGGNGQTIKYQYDKLNRIKVQTNSDDSYKTYDYVTDSSNNYVLAKDENANSAQYNSYGNQTKYKFDDLGNLVEEQTWAKDAAGNYGFIPVNQYTYDDKLRLDWEKNLVNGRLIDYTYNSDGRINTTKVQDTANGNKLMYQESYSYLDADPTGSFSKVTKTVKGEGDSPDVVASTYINKAGFVDKQERNHAGGVYTDTFKYDYLGNKTEEKSANAGSYPFTAKYTYNYAGQVTDVETVENKHTTTEYDALGRVVGVVDFKNNKTIYEYDDIGRRMKAIIPFEPGYNTTQKHYYDKTGNLVKQLVSSNKPGEAESWDRTDYEYNTRSMLTKVTTYVDGTTPENYTQYYYDAVGNKLRMYTGLSSPLIVNGLDNVINGNDTEYSTTKYEYNPLGKLTKKIDPGQKEETYEYDLNGTLKQQKDRNNSIITYSTDILSRMTGKSVTTPDGTGNTSYSYSYYLTGSRKSMAGGGSNATYYYDDLGRVKKEVDSNGITKEYDYDANNNRTAFIVKQGGATLLNTTYVYDSMNRLWKVLENGQVVATYTYDTNGNRDTLTYGNNVSTKYDYNSANKLKGLANKSAAGTALSKYDYTYYLDGNQASKTDASQGTINYKYDGLGRISTVEGANGLFKRYGYDDRNNRSDLTGTGEIFTYAEDMSFQYDGLNQLKSAVGHSASTYTYNGDGIRETKTVDGATTTQVLDGGNVAVEIKGNEVTKYVRGVNLISSEKNGQRYYYLHNGHGDVVQIVDNAGNVVNNYEYDEWGNITSQTETIENPFKYAGEYFDKETGLYYLRARYYDPTIGRFISEDSFPGEANDPLSLNLYTYAHNNPVNLFDPSGHEAASPDGTSGRHIPVSMQAILNWFYSGNDEYWTWYYGNYADSVKTEMEAILYDDPDMSFEDAFFYAYQRVMPGGEERNLAEDDPSLMMPNFRSNMSAVKPTNGTYKYGFKDMLASEKGAIGGKGFLTPKQMNQFKAMVLEGTDIEFATKGQAINFVKNKFSNFPEEVAQGRSAQGWHFDNHPINGSANDIEHINLYSKDLGFRVHITWRE